MARLNSSVGQARKHGEEFFRTVSQTCDNGYRLDSHVRDMEARAHSQLHTTGF